MQTPNRIRYIIAQKQKTEETFVFIFDREHAADMLFYIWDTAEDPETSFTCKDACYCESRMEDWLDESKP